LAGWPASQLTLSHNRSPVNPCVLDRVVNKADGSQGSAEQQ
jgi:hypothetical protein